MTTVPVVCAIIQRDGLVLLAQRAQGKHMALKWEFPGGKVEASETPEAALVREIGEELGCGIEQLEFLTESTHPYDAFSVRLIAYCCRITAGSPEPEPREHHALIWCPVTALLDYDLAPADVSIVAALQARWSSAPC